MAMRVLSVVVVAVVVVAAADSRASRDCTKPESSCAAITTHDVTALARTLVDPQATNLAQHDAFIALTAIGEDVDVSDAVDVLRRAIPTTDERIDQILIVLRSFGERAAAAIPEVRALRDRQPPLSRETRVSLSTVAMTSYVERPDLDFVLAHLGDDEPIVRVAGVLWTRSFDRYAAHRVLLTLGSRAEPAVPALIEQLRLGDFERQHRAAQLLGVIGDARATPALIAALSSKSWRVVGEAARALGLIGVDAGPEGTSSLATLRDAHWSSVVREAADIACRRTLGEHVVLAHKEADRVSVGANEWGSIDDPHGVTCRHDPDDGPRDELQMTASVDGHDVTLASTWRRPPLPAALPGNIPPPIGTGQVLMVGDVAFVARDDGEFGGDLQVVEGGTPTRLIERNTSVVVRIGDVVLAAGGMNHMGTNEGTVTRLRRRDGRWRAEPVAELPGDVSAFAVVGNRLVLGVGEEVVVVDVDGNIEAAPCRIVPNFGH